MSIYLKVLVLFHPQPLHQGVLEALTYHLYQLFQANLEGQVDLDHLLDLSFHSVHLFQGCQEDLDHLIHP